MITKAIVRGISSNYVNCIRDNSDEINIKKVNEQHENYVVLLKELHMDVIELPALDDFPDCCFVEDTIVIYKNNAYIPIMGGLSRRGENIQVIETLKKYKSIKQGTIESMDGGDVLHFNDYLISGCTSRTTLKGIEEASKLLGVNIKNVEDPNIVHLKSYVSKLSENSILLSQKYQNHEVFKNFDKIIVPDSEIYASNVLEVNGNIIMPSGYPETFKLLKQNGFTDVHTLETGEFKICEGALTCLSILF